MNKEYLYFKKTAQRRNADIQQENYNEVEVYVKEIQPKVKELESLCVEHGIPFICSIYPSKDGENCLQSVTSHFSLSQQKPF